MPSVPLYGSIDLVHLSRKGSCCVDGKSGGCGGVSGRVGGLGAGGGFEAGCDEGGEGEDEGEGVGGVHGGWGWDEWGAAGVTYYTLNWKLVGYIGMSEVCFVLLR